MIILSHFLGKDEKWYAIKGFGKTWQILKSDSKLTLKNCKTFNINYIKDRDHLITLIQIKILFSKWECPGTERKVHNILIGLMQWKFSKSQFVKSPFLPNSWFAKSLFVESKNNIFYQIHNLPNYKIIQAIQYN